MKTGFLLVLLGSILITGCASSGEVIPAETQPDELALSDEARLVRISQSMPRVDREFRAVWVATVDNIDWPSEPGLPVLQQKAEMMELLDRAALMNMNAIIFQIRPTADAFYKSELEPWSYYLTGENGLAPSPEYDPLQFAIEEAHRRGIELHAWFNPYRAYHQSAPDTLSGAHVSDRLPGSVHRYGEMLWMDPGSETATEHSVSVILDVVERYDIDGVHLDDYFYPYSINDEDGNRVEFPDSSFYELTGDGLSRGDWRRRNVDQLIERLYSGIKERKPWVLFGISPFGIWRPGYPEGITGFDAYANLYADAKKWLQEGWVDYFTPQLYWKLDSSGQPYGALLSWWVEQNLKNRHIWPGNYTSRIILEGNSHWEPDEVVAQVRHTRQVSGATGNVHFSMRAIMPADHGMGSALAEGVYETPALRPRTTWLGMNAPPAPGLAMQTLGDQEYVTLQTTGNVDVRYWIVHEQRTDGWATRVVPGWNRVISIPEQTDEDKTMAFVVRAVNRLGMESEPSILLVH